MSQKLVTKMSEFIKISMKTKNGYQLNSCKQIKALAQDIALRDKRKDLKDEDIITAAMKCKAEAAESKNIYSVIDSPIANENYTKAHSLDVVCDRFLPEQMTEDEIERYVTQYISELSATTMKDMGTVMKEFNSKHPKGTFDGKLVSSKIKSKLN